MLKRSLPLYSTVRSTQKQISKVCYSDELICDENGDSANKSYQAFGKILLMDDCYKEGAENENKYAVFIVCNTFRL